MTEQAEKTTEESKEPSVRDVIEEAAAELEAQEAPKEAEKAEKVEEKSEETPPEAPEKVETGEEVASEPVEMPEWWGTESGVWEALPREAQDHLIARERERTEAIERDRMPDDTLAWLRQVEEEARLAGVTPAQALERFVTAHRQLSSNPTYAFSVLANQYGFDPSQLAAAPVQDGQTQQEADPLQMVDRFVQQRLSQWEQAQLDKQTQSVLGELEQWVYQKDADGNPLRPHFEELQHLVKPEMDRLMGLNPHREWKDSLQEAYDNVAKLKAPDVEAIAEQKAQEKLKQMQEEAKKAQAAQVSPASGPSGTATDTSEEPKTVREAIEQAARELEGTAARI